MNRAAIMDRQLIIRLEMRIRPYAVVFMLAMLMRLGWIAVNYTPDFARFQTGDYRLYEIGGEHLLRHGDFNNSLFLVRPPYFHY